MYACQERTDGGRSAGEALNLLRPLDLQYQGHRELIGVYVVDTDFGPALFDTGPASTLSTLEAGLAEHRTSLAEIEHVLLSHVHLDLAGAVGTIARNYPQINVWVAEAGAPHLVDPSRLERSARRVFGDAFDALWGEVVPVPETNVRIASGSVLGWEVCQPSGTRRTT